jgi:hypothetical protein
VYERHKENPEDTKRADSFASRRSSFGGDDSRYSALVHRESYAPCRHLIKDGKITKEAKDLGYKNIQDVMNRSISDL